MLLRSFWVYPLFGGLLVFFMSVVVFQAVCLFVTLFVTFRRQGYGNISERNHLIDRVRSP